MKLHSVQKKYFEPFITDTKTGKLWVYPRDGSTKFRKPISWCTAEDDFQSPLLEKEQNTIIEAPGIIALRRLKCSVELSEDEYHRISKWTALHVIRNQKMRRELGDDYERIFRSEFEKELLFTKEHYCKAFACPSTAGNFFITSDNPVIEVQIPDGPQVRLLTITPDILVVFTPRYGKLSPENQSMEDYINSAIWASSADYVYSHSDGVCIDKYKQIAEQYGMKPVFENQQVSILGYSEFQPSGFPE